MESVNIKQRSSIVQIHAGLVVPVITSVMSDDMLEPTNGNSSLLSPKDSHEDIQGEEGQQDIEKQEQEIKKQHQDKSKQTVVTSKSFHRLPWQLDPNFGLLQQTTISQSSHISSHERIQKLLQILPKASSLSSLKDDIVLVFGGIVNTADNHIDTASEILLYLPRESTWLFYDTMPEPRCYHAVSLMDNTVYVTGGYSIYEMQHGEMMPSRKTFCFCVKKEIWKSCADMQDARACHAMVAAKKKIYVFGGRGIYGCSLSSVEMFDPVYNVWTTVSVMPQPCMGLSAVCCERIIWVIGGVTSTEDIDKSSFLSTVLSYDPSSKVWNSQPNLPSAKAYSSAVTFNNNIWLLGGATLTDAERNLKLGSVSEVLCLSTSADEWHHKTNLCFSLHSSTAVVVGSKIYSIGGMNSEMNSPCKVANVIDVETCVCSQHPIPIAVAGSCSVYLPHEQTKTLVSPSASEDAHPNVLPTAITQVEKENHKDSTVHDKISGDLQFESGSEKVVTSLPCCEYKELMFDSTTRANTYLVNNNSTLPAQASNHSVSSNSTLSANAVDFKNKHAVFTMDLKQSKLPSEKSSSKMTKSVRNYEYNIPTSSKLFRSTFIMHLKSGFVHKIFQEYDILNVAQKHIVSEKLLMSRMMDAEIPVCISSEKKLDETLSADDDDTLPPMRIAKDTFAQKEYDTYAVTKTRKKKSFPSVEDLKFAAADRDSDERLYRVVKIIKVFPPEKYISDVHYYPDFCTLAKMTAQCQDLKSDKEEGMQEFVLGLQRTQCTQELQLPVILVFGGLTNTGIGDIVLRFNQIKNLWEYAGKMPEFIMYHSVVLLKHVLYVIGGFDLNVALYGKIMPTDSVISYDLKERHWKHKTQMLHSRAYHNTIEFNGHIFVIGGQDHNGMILSSIEMYDVVEDNWIVCKDVPYPVMGATACVFQGCIYIIGGVTFMQGKQQITRNVVMYNPASGRWSSDQSLPHAIAYASVSCTLDQLWLFGGLTFDGHSFKSLQDILVFDVLSSEWRIVGKLSTPKHCTNSLAIDSCCYIIGGITSNGNCPVNSTDLFMCCERKTVPLSPLPVTLIGTSALLLPPVHP